MRERETERMTYIQTERMMSCLRVAVKNNQQERLCLNERERLFMTKIMYLSEKETETKIECVCVRERDGERDTRGRREGREMINRQEIEEEREEKGERIKRREQDKIKERRERVQKERKDRSKHKKREKRDERVKEREREERGRKV